MRSSLLVIDTLENCYSMLPTALYVTHPDGRIIYGNEEFRHLFKLPSHEKLLGRHASTLYAKSGKSSRLMPQALVSPVQQSSSRTFRRFDNSTFLGEQISQKRTIAGANLFVQIIRDLTYAEAYDANIDFFTKNAPVAYHIVDQNGVIRYVNRKHCDLLGVDISEVQGKKVWDLYVDDQKEDVRRSVQDKLTRRKTVGDGVYRNLRAPDGSSIPVLIKDYLTSYRGETELLSSIEDVRVGRSVNASFCRPWILETSFFDVGEICAFAKTISGLYESGNSSFCAAVGLTQRSLVGKRDTDIYDKDAAKRYQVEDQWIISNKKPLQKVALHAPINGTTSVIHTVKVPLLNDAGSVVSIQGVYWEVGIAAEKRESLELGLAALQLNPMQNAQIGVFRSTPEGKIVEANKALAQLLGYSDVNDLITNISDIGDQVYVNKAHRKEHIRRLIEHGVINQEEYEVIRKDRHRMWLSESSRAIYTPGTRKLQFIVGSIQEITRLKEAELRFIQLRDEGSDPIYTHTETEPFRFTSLNNAGQRLTGYTNAEFIALDPRDFIHPNSLSAVMESLQKKRDNVIAASEAYTIVIKTKGGVYVPLLVSSHKFANSQGDSEIQGIAKNIPIQEQHSRMLKLNALTQDGALLLHDLIGSVYIVLNWVEYIEGKLRQKNKNKLSESHRRLITGVKAIRDQRSALEAILTNEASRVKFEKTTPRQLARECKSLCNFLINQTRQSAGGHVQLKTFTCKDRVHVSVDRAIMRRVISNLVSNSCQHTGVSQISIELVVAKIPMRVPSLSTSSSIDKRCLKITVCDDGPGIDEPRLTAILGGFTVESDKKGHNGLGLAVVSQSIRLHNGYFTIRNTSPGLEAIICLPLLHASK